MQILKSLILIEEKKGNLILQSLQFGGTEYRDLNVKERYSNSLHHVLKAQFFISVGCQWFLAQILYELSS